MTRTLDLGCGPEPKNPFSAAEVFGIDIFSLPEKNILKADLIVEAIPFPENYFDYVTAHDFIEHVPRIIYAPHRIYPFIEIMNEIYRVLKMGGLFYSHTPAVPSLAAFQDPTHVNFITQDTFSTYFDDHRRLGAVYGFKGAFLIQEQHWSGGHLVSLMKKV